MILGFFLTETDEKKIVELNQEEEEVASNVVVLFDLYKFCLC